MRYSAMLLWDCGDKKLWWYGTHATIQSKLQWYDVRIKNCDDTEWTAVIWCEDRKLQWCGTHAIICCDDRKLRRYGTHAMICCDNRKLRWYRTHAMIWNPCNNMVELWYELWTPAMIMNYKQMILKIIRHQTWKGKKWEHTTNLPIDLTSTCRGSHHGAP